MIQNIVAVVVFLSLLLYALMGGADFGGGMWDLLASGPRAARQRKAIAEAIGPIWEANHVCSSWWWCFYSPVSRLASRG